MCRFGCDSAVEEKVCFLRECCVQTDLVYLRNGDGDIGDGDNSDGDISDGGISDSGISDGDISDGGISDGDTCESLRQYQVPLGPLT